MFTTSTLPSTSSVLSMYSTFAAMTMLVRTVLNEVRSVTAQLIPHTLQTKIASILGRFLSLDPSSSLLTLYINEYDGMSYNELFQASEAYLSTRINDSIGQLRVSKNSQDESLSIMVNRGQKIHDVFQGVDLVWEFVTKETQQIVVNYEDMTGEPSKSEHKTLMLSFHKQHKDKILSSYLPRVIKTFKEIESSKRYVRLYAYGSITGQYDGPWAYINLDHPSTFQTLAIDPTVKKEIIDDLDRFVKRREFYRRVGKPWKRGYLLYGPPGTGKSSLVAAVANYLKFDVYDLELASVASNGELRRLLTGTANRSIVVIEDIDCTVDLQNRGGSAGCQQNGTDSQLTLSGLLNFIDGLWSSCGDERIRIFTTNHKEKLDPALLRPGRMDMHIHMSYCSPGGFRILASNYLQVESHVLFGQIEQLVEEIEVTPAEIAEELMKGEDVHVVLEGVVGFLKKKKKGMKLENEEVENKV